MTRRNAKIGFVALLMAALIGGVALEHRAAHAWGKNHRATIMKRVISAHIDEVLDEAKVTDAQRQTIYAARDRIFVAFENQHGTHRAHMEDALQLFEADQVDTSKLAELRAQREVEMKQLVDTVTQAVIEVHDVLTPQQRRAVTDHIRSFRGQAAE
jgi:Spy/CpxP family protein refolding chaperone